MSNAKNYSPTSHFFQAPPDAATPEAHWVPSLDMWECGEVMVICVDLPGVSPRDVSLTLQGDLMLVTGKRLNGREPQTAGFFSEQSYGPFSRRVRVPPGVVLDRAVITFERGVLEIRAPYSRGASQVH